MGLIILSPIFIFFLSRKLNLKDFPFSFKDLLYVVSPFAVCWILFIAVFNKAYLLNLFNSVNLFLPSHSSAGLIHINWEVVKQISISAAFLSLFFISIKKLPVYFLITGCALLSLTMLLIINTQLLSFLMPYYSSWSSRPMWFSSLLMGFTILFWIQIITKFVLKKILSTEEELAIILMVPFTICALTMSVFSSLGTLAVSQSAIPAVAAIAYMLTPQLKNMKYQHQLAIVTIILLLGPFYYTTAQNDWNFSFYDVSPRQANVSIEEGFGKDIKTNQMYKSLHEWIRKNTEEYSNKDDFIISYVLSPMVHMIAKRRPSLDDTFVSFKKPIEYYDKSIAKMKERHRCPKIAFVFENVPALVPISLKNGTYRWSGKEFILSKSNDPVSGYVLQNMALVDEFEISSNNKVSCFVDKKTLINKKIDENIAFLKESLIQTPSDTMIHYKLGNLFQKKEMHKNALEHYNMALHSKPDFINALNGLVNIHAQQGEYQKAIDSLMKIIEIQPGNANAYYNVACLYAKQNRIDTSVDWLKKAVEKGFDNWELLKKDRDFDNIRNTEYYKKLIRMIKI